jgi:hypothetical protein
LKAAIPPVERGNNHSRTGGWRFPPQPPVSAIIRHNDRFNLTKENS